MSSEKLFKIKLDRKSKTPLHTQIVDSIGALIISGEISPHEAMPDERSLSKALGINRLSLRKALKQLEHSGLIRRIQGKGTFARELINDEAIRDLQLPNRKSVLISQPWTIEHNFSGLIRSISAKYLHQAKIETVFANFKSSLDESDLLKYFSPVLSGAILYRWGNYVIQENIDWLKERNIPFLVCGAEEDRFNADFVGISFRKCFYDATDYFINKGHRDILFVSQNVPLNLSSISGYEKAMEKADLPLMVIGKYSNPPFSTTFRHDINTIYQGYYETINYFKDASKYPTAIVAESAQLGIGIMKALKELEISVPENIEVLAFGDSPYLDAYFGVDENPLSTMELPLEPIGKKAAELLINRFENPNKKQEKVEFSIVVVDRKTTRKV
jgi:DNA-binding LacI/PurR family transcriptional regulator